jgi:Sigma-70, region 4
MSGPDVAAAIAALDAEHRQVIIEIYYRNRSVGETADLLHVSAATVAARAHSAMRQLLATAVAVRQLPRVPDRSADRAPGDRWPSWRSR